jgi:uncharacterized protein YbaR (Trm112 family)
MRYHVAPAVQLRVQRNRHGKIFCCEIFRNGAFMISQTLIEILRCPNCVRTTGGELKLHKDVWFICKDCGRKYPIVDDIPVMLIEEGDKWTNVAEAELPVPPPAK